MGGQIQKRVGHAGKVHSRKGSCKGISDDTIVHFSGGSTTPVFFLALLFHKGRCVGENTVEGSKSEMFAGEITHLSTLHPNPQTPNPPLKKTLCDQDGILVMPYLFETIILWGCK
jgi:hypothetical protein